MNRLSNYLVRLFAAEAIALFGVSLTILFLVQTLRFVDATSVRGQGLVTLLWQVILNMPPVGIAFLYVCLAIGLGRALRAMQASRELHILHVSQRLPALFSGAAVYVAGGAILVLLLAHVVEPATTRQDRSIRSQVAADLVGRSLVPNRFAEVTGGVTITVGGRRADGEITSFFADDRRDATRRTYIAESALISRDELGYVLQLRNGAIQYRSPEGKFSEISFVRYDLPIERLTGDSDTGGERGDRSTYALVAASLAEGEWPGSRLVPIVERTVEGLRVIALCLFVFAIAGFPSGRRRESWVPLEITVLAATFLERGISAYAPGGWLSSATGVVVLATIAIVVLIFRLRAFAPQPNLAHAR